MQKCLSEERKRIKIKLQIRSCAAADSKVWDYAGEKVELGFANRLFKTKREWGEGGINDDEPFVGKFNSKTEEKTSAHLVLLAKVRTVEDKTESTSFNIFAAECCVFVIIEFVSPH